LPNATDADRRTYLLQQLQNHPQPWYAKFVCVLCLTLPNGVNYFTQGECQGIIIPQERGHNGFGYDPIFYIPQINKTMAELKMEEKNRLSHRARAVQSAIKLWFS
jgi:XTP/dITP diphosphohydrolase